VIIIRELYGVIYCATNIINNKKYIGQTIRNLDKRKQEHISQSYNGGNLAIHQAIRKYGEDNFKWHIIDNANSQEELDDKEKFWINYYDTYNSSGYNMALGGQFNLSDNADELSAMRGGREFLVYDLDGNFIKETMSQTEFAEEIGVSIKTVNHVLTGIKQSTKGYMLFYKDEFKEEKVIEQVNKIKNRHRPFTVFDKNQEFVGIWNNKVRCAREINCSPRIIYTQFESKTNIKYRKYKFYYLEDIPNHLKNKLKDVI
jgi:group I intron endonuclease